MSKSGSIPMPWIDDDSQKENADGRNSTVDAISENSRKRRAEGRRESELKHRQQPHQQDESGDNSCSDDDEPKQTDISPGTPVAQSTPLLRSGGGSSATASSTAAARSAFAMLQPAIIPAHNSGGQPPQFPHNAGGPYFFPPPPMPMGTAMDQQQMMYSPYHHFMRWSAMPPTSAMGMGYGYPMMGGMMSGMAKMEPGDDNLMEQQLHQLPLGGTGAGPLPKKRRIANGMGNRKKKNTLRQMTEEEEQQQKSGDSGLGLGDSVLTNGSLEFGEEQDIEEDFSSMEPKDDQPSATEALFPINGFETYCTVPGRLTLLSNLKKYRVSIAEIQRRLSPPECLNASILGGILRKAKNKDGGKLLREQLLTYGVELPSGRRKQGPLTCFSSMVEEEAAQLARDFHLISQNNYPVRAAAAFALTEVQTAQDVSISRLELYYASKFINRMLDFHRADRSPVADQPWPADGVDHNSLAELRPELQQGLTNFSLLTHGFGARILQSVLDTLLDVINECNGTVDRNFGSAQAGIVAGHPGQVTGNGYTF